MMYAFAFLKIEHVEDEFLEVVSKAMTYIRT